MSEELPTPKPPKMDGMSPLFLLIWLLMLPAGWGLAEVYKWATAPEKLPFEKGECFVSGEKEERLFEVLQVTEVYKEGERQRVRYVYNFPNSDKFAWGQWFTSPLANEPLDWFIDNINSGKYRRIECPW